MRSRNYRNGKKGGKSRKHNHKKGGKSRKVGKSRRGGGWSAILQPVLDCAVLLIDDECRPAVIVI